MLPFAETVITGVVTGVYADRIRRKIDSWINSGDDTPGLTDYERANLLQNADQIKLLQRINHNTTDIDAPKNAKIEQTVQLQTEIYINISRDGRAHLCMFAAASVPMKMQVPGLGFISTTLAAGWNTVDMPEGTRYCVPTGTSPTTVLVVKDDQAIGSAI
jgi:hypothetical protein